MSGDELISMVRDGLPPVTIIPGEFYQVPVLAIDKRIPEAEVSPVYLVKFKKVKRGGNVRWLFDKISLFR
jgi:hypothetical protein